MARKLRIQYAGACYHVINRGNYRRDLFESPGTAEAFLRVLFEAVEKFGWEIYAWVLMRNHYHLALGTPDPTLVEGMHWLQSTLATRFNRFRKESGHLFQGRYKSILLEDEAIVGRVVDYIHLNPVRAKIVTPEQVGAYRWSSLVRFIRGSRKRGMLASEWLKARGGWDDSTEGWKAYEAHLVEIGRDEAAWEREGLVGLSKGWAIGTPVWRQAVAKDHARLSLNPGMEQEEIQELRRLAWVESLHKHLRLGGKNQDDLKSRPKNLPWKVTLAYQIRQETGAPIPWLAANLHLGKPASVRSYLSRHGILRNQQTTA
ncbi:hypothetical protein OPIT5_16545 [Opitutaceae bacterium TAV5]|nr:hypothetical protein OPIT5_16545 [Opitutaceae bacterium TAV5]